MGEDKGARFNMRVDPAELGRWKLKAKKSDLSVSDWLRFLANEDVDNPNSIIFSIPAPEEEQARWKKMADAEGLTMSAWVTAMCNAATYDAASVTVPPTPEETAALPVEDKKRLVTGVQKLRPSKTEKKQARKENARVARDSVVLPKRPGGGMVDIHLPPTETAPRCKHGKMFGERCKQCDPKQGYPLFD